MCNGDYTSIGKFRPDGLLNNNVRRHVDARRSLIRYDQVGTTQHGTGHGKKLTLSLTERCTTGTDLGIKSDLGFTDSDWCPDGRIRRSGIGVVHECAETRV